MPIDLHTHSTASDGTLTPRELVQAAAGAGLDVVALTDHDTTAGWAEAVAALPAGLSLVRGAELSCRWSGAPDRPIALHMLAYLFDPDEPALSAELARMRETRERRAERMVELLRTDGIDVTWAEVWSYAQGNGADPHLPGVPPPPPGDQQPIAVSVGRPHIAQALIRRGLVANTNEAFGPEWLGKKYRLPKEDMDVFAALGLVRDAGGLTVFAHPRASKRGRVVPDELIVELAGAGLFGLEADHEDHTLRERAEIRALAADLGLVVTGSSDFHGKHKTVRLGAHTTSPEVYEKIVAAATGSAVV